MKALLLIDIQQGLTSKSLYNESLFVDTVNYAVNRFRCSGDLIIFVPTDNKHLRFSQSDWRIDSRVDKRKDDVVILKECGNAFVSTDLKPMLDKHAVKDIFICGLVSHGCIKATCIGGFNLGYLTNLIAKGHTGWTQDARERISTTESELSRLGVKIVDKEAL